MLQVQTGKETGGLRRGNIGRNKELWNWERRANNEEGGKERGAAKGHGIRKRGEKVR